jgi:hypothetical protein
MRKLEFSLQLLWLKTMLLPTMLSYGTLFHLLFPQPPRDSFLQLTLLTLGFSRSLSSLLLLFFPEVRKWFWPLPLNWSLQNLYFLPLGSSSVSSLLGYLKKSQTYHLSYPKVPHYTPSLKSSPFWIFSIKLFYPFFLLVVLQFELRASRLLFIYSTTWATPLAFFCDGFCGDRVSWTICQGLALNHDPPDLCLLNS